MHAKPGPKAGLPCTRLKTFSYLYLSLKSHEASCTLWRIA